MVLQETTESKISPTITSKHRKKVKEICPSFRRGHLPNKDDVERLRSLTRPHVESFNYFLQSGLAKGIKAIPPAELDIVDLKRLREDRSKIDWEEITTVKFWFEDVRVVKSAKPSSAGRSEGKLYPTECRQRSLTYSGQILGKFCYEIIQRRNGVTKGSVPYKMPKTFGVMPIMVGSNACHLEGLTPKELVDLREEVCYFFYGARFFSFFVLLFWGKLRSALCCICRILNTS
jgi:DNA-directed RNA polymerase beta subunit